VALGTLVAAALLDFRSVVGILAAGVVAVPVQVAAFAVLVRARAGGSGFLVAWVGGTLARLAAVGLGGWALVALLDLPPLPTLLGLAGFFFVMLVMETHFLGRGETRGP